MRRLIVNADDFGLSENVNLGIAKAHREGVVTSASLLACGRAAGHAAALAKENPALGVGVHLCLTRERPLAKSKQIPTLAADVRLPASPFTFMRRLMAGAIKIGEVETELRAQIERALSLGISPTHLDGHQHLHVMPQVFPIVVKLARESGIPAVRFPVGPWRGRTGPARAAEKFMLELLAGRSRALLGSSGLAHPDYFFGLLQYGRLDDASLAGIIEGLPEGTSEIMCHPGLRDDALAKDLDWGYGWEKELKAVTDERVKRLVKENSIELVSFGALK